MRLSTLLFVLLTLTLTQLASADFTVARRHRGDINGLAWSPDGRTLASAHDEKVVILWNVFTGQRNATFSGAAFRLGASGCWVLSEQVACRLLGRQEQRR